MKETIRLYREPKPAVTPAGWVALGLFVFGAVVLLIGNSWNVKVGELIRDPAAQFHFPVYAGLLSHLGIGLLVATAGITAFAAGLVNEKKLRGLLGFVAVFNVVLAVDDQFMLHEEVGPKVLGIPEKAIFLIYGVMAWAMLKQVRNVASEKSFDLSDFWFAGMLLGGSVVVDVLKVGGLFQFWLEDLLKLAGFGAWLMFWGSFSGSLVRSSMEQSVRGKAGSNESKPVLRKFRSAA